MNPNPIIVRAKDSMQPGSILDLGAGNGRNGLYLAQLGFNVTLVDKDTALVNTDLPNVTIVQADLVNYEFPKSVVNNVICSFVLHFLDINNSTALISKIKHATNIGGINVISDFVGPVPGDLRKLYSDWEIIHYEESTTLTYDGGWKTAAHIIAKKPQ